MRKVVVALCLIAALTGCRRAPPEYVSHYTPPPYSTDNSKTPPPDPDSGLALAPGHDLPSDAECAGRVVAAEPKHDRATRRSTRRVVARRICQGPSCLRVSGDFTGTTDEIIQWAACKWGIAADVVRAQAVAETAWDMTDLGDFTDDSQWCARPRCWWRRQTGMPAKCRHPPGEVQVSRDAFPEAAESTAYNLDYVLGVWRTCFEGQETWLADNPPASGYHAGDMWGCLGRWHRASGAPTWRWPTSIGCRRNTTNARGRLPLR